MALLVAEQRVRFEGDNNTKSTADHPPPPQESMVQPSLDLTEAQIAGFRKVFQYFDKDDNGSVDSSEIFSQATTLGLDVSYEQVCPDLA